MPNTRAACNVKILARNIPDAIVSDDRGLKIFDRKMDGNPLARQEENSPHYPPTS